MFRIELVKNARANAFCVICEALLAYIMKIGAIKILNLMFSFMALYFAEFRGTVFC